MSKAKQRTAVGLLAVLAVAAAALLAVFGLPYGASNPDAFAHLYTAPNGNTTHLHIDADLADGFCTAPYDATVTVGSVHDVGVCLETYTPTTVNNFQLRVYYTGDPDALPPTILNSSPNPGCAPADPKCLDSNPDANDGTGSDKIGTGWDCTGLGIAPPVGEDTATVGVADAFIVCNASLGAPDQQLADDPGLLATIEFTALSAGVDTVDFGPIDATNATNVQSPRIGGGAARCGTAVAADHIGCFGATITKVPDLGIVKTAVPNPAIAGSTVLFNTALTDGPGVVLQVLDDMDEDLVFNPGLSDPSCVQLIPAGAPSPGVADPPNGTNVIACAGPFAVPGAGPTIAADVPLSEAGKAVSNGAGIVPPDPNTANDSSFIVVPVADAVMTITDTSTPLVHSVGDSFDWTVTATSTGGSPASDVVITKTVDTNQVITTALLSVPGACVITPDNVTPGNTATCTVTGPVAAPNAAVATITVDVVDSVGNECTNAAEVCWADPVCAQAAGSEVCLPPTVRMEKDIDTDASTIDNAVNLFIQKDGAGGFVPLIIYELVSNPGNDPDGVGAYEFQLKFNHKLFDIEIADTSWLSNGGQRTVDCSMTIITENDIRWGCVSSGPPGTGQTVAGVAAIITVYPEADMYLRLTPGQENGVFGMLLDENCELADVFGDPLKIVNPDGSESLAPGVQPGGTLEVCSDMGITIRILEGDLDLDCVVGLLDEQAIAFRYGAVFGTLYYDPWYDLEPWNKDYDIDIKDLQKVWGRQGSVCDMNGVGTIPPQLPVEVPDP